MIQFLATNCGGTGTLRTVGAVSGVMSLLFAFVPAGLILMISVDFLKNVIASNADNMQKNLQLTIKRIIMCVGLFLVPTIVNWTMSLVGGDIVYCINLARSGDYSKVEQKKYEDKSSGVEVELKKGKKIKATTIKQKTQEFLNSLEKISKKIQEDAKNNNDWIYSNSRTESTFDNADKTTKTSNCALYIVWGLVDVGILEEGEGFYKNYGEEIIYYGENAEKNINEKMTLTKTDNKKASELIEDGTIKEGDIILWGDGKRHTNVYAGNKKWYDAGMHTNVNGCCETVEEQFKFSTFGPMSLSYLLDTGVYGVLRIK